MQIDKLQEANKVSDKLRRIDKQIEKLCDVTVMNNGLWLNRGNMG